MCSPNRLPLPVAHVSTKEDFLSQVYPSRHPTVLRGFDLGPAPQLWTPEYLCQKCGRRPVKVHVCPTPRMDFLNKNFAYKTLPFDEFVKRASKESSSSADHFFCPEEKYYLRALGDDPRKDVADLKTQFPTLAGDITLPLFCEPEQYFSSVFRIGSPHVQLWTHYDVMDNLLVQVSGRKRVVLFSPRDAANLYLVGDKSQVLDIDTPDLSVYPHFAQVSQIHCDLSSDKEMVYIYLLGSELHIYVHMVQQFECLLEPGDVLFIPALWFHNVTSLEFGVAVNIFWRQLDTRLYDSKDTYGNRDPPAAQRAFQIVDRALKVLDELPEEYRDFYARCLMGRIEAKATSKS